MVENTPPPPKHISVYGLGRMPHSLATGNPRITSASLPNLCKFFVKITSLPNFTLPRKKTKEMLSLKYQRVAEHATVVRV